MRSKLVTSLVIVPAVTAGLLALIFFLAQFSIFFRWSDEDLIQALRTNRSSDIRWYAALQLGARNVPAAVPALADALRRPDPAPEVRWHAALALAHMSRLGNEEAHREAPLIIGLLDDPDPRARKLACEALVVVGDPALAGPPLLARVEAPDSTLRQAVVWALGELGVAEARPALAHALASDPIREVRWNAALSLARLGDPSGRAVLHEMLAEPSEEVAGNAVAGLRLVGDASSIPLLERVRTAAEGLPLADRAAEAIAEIRRRLAAGPPGNP